ncbi:BH3 interacting domain death agonist [Lampris incognitus]|uniref:BH3 interacting domain death agonist n=1 Tax=Lampris incognitus TaxID=2546036 RepID=UPI0024B4BB2D|nr:BH3 interacting domain death agonist [Lampris incognitus]
MEGVSGRLSTPLVLLSFLHQADCGADLRREVDSLGKELNFTRGDAPCIDPAVGDGELQTDGHTPSSIKMLSGGFQPQFEQQQRPINPNEAQALQAVTAELRAIADQLEERVVTQASRNLARNLSNAPVFWWIAHLTLEVEWVLKQGLFCGLENLPQEQVIMALTLSLVKGVCDKAPQLLRNLFNTALQYINSTVSRGSWDV